ncbi:hypothetical protein Vadar_000656 [Vaccinium darrowii]|uniref:Uncharacterized protein n=1 Tax=Vaccinium darrowii TaxID=229202 RepID=A0ACB7XNI2_9ERIC|nr:hypothetical protein Vadar_000656 [Vaccinium darrowii]
MVGRTQLLQIGRFRLENLSQNALATMRNFFFMVLVLGVFMIFILITATYQPHDPLYRPSTKNTALVPSTFESDVHEDVMIAILKHVCEVDKSFDCTKISKKEDVHPLSVPIIRETVNDSLPVIHPKKEDIGSVSLPTVGETVNDSLPVDEFEASFIRGRYLVYNGGGDRCKSMDHYLWSFMSALGEAQYLNRTLVMDTSICLSSIYTSSHKDEEGKNFRFYFDYEHLKESAYLLDSRQFAFDWTRWHRKNGLKLKVIEDFRVSPMMLSVIEDTSIMRKFGSTEPDNYWSRVCEGEAKSVVRRPWHLVGKSKRLMDIVSAIASRLNWDFDSVRVERGEKAKNKEVWPNLDADTSPKALLAKLTGKIEDGRNLYVATNEPNASFFDPLKERYSTHFLDEYKDLWDEKSEWYAEITKLNNGVPVEFDGYMKFLVDTEVFWRGTKRIETFNDLSKDCKDGINTCTSSAI